MASSNTDKKRVLILGGGFGGVTTAQRLHHHFKRDAHVEITLVNRDNFFVFVPLLASAASGSIETLHILNPIRRMIHGITFRAEEVMEIDLQRHIVTTASSITGREVRLPYDHLVLGLGNTINLASLPGLAQHAKTMKSLGDALHLRNHVISMLEAADVETDPHIREELLTFVVAGAGYSGVETVGEINDLVHEISKNYPSLTRESIKVILLHSRDRILPEMGPGLADFALKKLRQRGVDVRLQTLIAAATPHEAILNTGERIPTRTLMVTVGAAINPVLASLALPREKDRILTDSFISVPGMPGVWALGDNAAVPNAAANGEFSPPTAQYALRQGRRLADNLAAVIRGQPQQQAPFAFPGLGQLCLVGHRAGVAELAGGLKLSGFIAWLMWRNVYLMKLPGWDRRIRVGLDWTLDLIFPPELSYINLARTQVVNQVHFEPGDFIIRQGDVGDQFYVIVAGEVNVFKELPNGEQAHLAKLGKGEYFGESALLTGRRRNATVQATTRVDLMCLGRDEFNNLAGAWLKFSESVQSLSAERGKALSSDIERSREFRTIVVGSAPGAHLARLGPPPVPATPSSNTASSREAAPPPPSYTLPPSPPFLVRSDGAELPLEADALNIGRAPDNHIVVNDRQVSRRHAVLKREGTNYVLEDLGTPNGTFVNDQRIQRHILASGDVIRLGNTVFTYRVPAVEQR
jgi:NADH:ubiquinone reductase (H+-translocating)